MPDFSFATTPGPRIQLYPMAFAESLGDDPEKHRWRAQWETQLGGPNGFEEVGGIALSAYPVAGRTATGAWIDPNPFAKMVSWTEEGAKYDWCDLSELRHCKFVTDDGAQAWAKPTQEAALHSLVVRLDRWAGHLARDATRMLAATETAEMLIPEQAELAERARDTFTASVRKRIDLDATGSCSLESRRKRMT